MKLSAIAMSAIMLAIFLAMTGVAFTYPESSRFQPLVIGIPAIALCILQLVLDARGRAASDQEALPTQALPHRTEPDLVLAREAIAWAYFLGLVAGVVLLGFWVAIPVFLVIFLRREATAGWPQTLGLGLGVSVGLYALFTLGLRVGMHDGFVLQWLRG